jgi:hypothetical protein
MRSNHSKVVQTDCAPTPNDDGQEERPGLAEALPAACLLDFTEPPAEGEAEAAAPALHGIELRHALSCRGASLFYSRKWLPSNLFQ